MSFSFSTGIGPRSAVSDFGQVAKEGRFFDRTVVGAMLTFVRPYKRKMLLAVGLMLLATVFTLLTPYLIKQAIDGYIAAGDTDGLARLAVVIVFFFPQIALWLPKTIGW